MTNTVTTTTIKWFDKVIICKDLDARKMIVEGIYNPPKNPKGTTSSEWWFSLDGHLNQLMARLVDTGRVIIKDNPYSVQTLQRPERIFRPYKIVVEEDKPVITVLTDNIKDELTEIVGQFKKGQVSYDDMCELLCPYIDSYSILIL